MTSRQGDGVRHLLFDDSDDEEEDLQKRRDDAVSKRLEESLKRAAAKIEEQRRREATAEEFKKWYQTLFTPEQAQAARERAKEVEDKRVRELSRLMKQGSLDSSGGARVTFPDGPVIALSLDAGGGNRTIIQLDMLDLLMEKIANDLGLYSKGPSVVLRPCEVFQLIVGSGTGGLIAIMLGRLRMSVQEVKEFYRGFEEAVFRPLSQVDNVLDVSPAYKDEIADHIAKKITELVKIRDIGTRLQEDENPALGKVLVTAVEEYAKDRFIIRKFRSHTCTRDLDYSDDSECSITEAVQATVAQSVFFNPSLAETARDRDDYSPTPFGFSPIKLAAKEAKLAFAYGKRMGSEERIIVSIGAGIPGRGENKSTTKTQTQRPEQLKGEKADKMTLDQILDWNALLCAVTAQDEDSFRFNCAVDRPTDPKAPDNIRLEDEANLASFAIRGARRQCILYENPSLRPPRPMDDEQVQRTLLLLK